MISFLLEMMNRCLPEFKNSMKHEFNVTDLGKMRYFLDLEVLQRSDGIFISQKKYALEVLQRFGMDKSNFVHNPIVPGFKLVKDEGGVKVDKTYYKHIVGSLMYVTATQPNMKFVVSHISRYMENPNELHLQVAKRVLRYLKGTTGFGIFYRKGGKSDELLLKLTGTMLEIWKTGKALQVMCFY